MLSCNAKMRVYTNMGWALHCCVGVNGPAPRGKGKGCRQPLFRDSTIPAPRGKGYLHLVL